jgi:hypothetical protein
VQEQPSSDKVGAASRRRAVRAAIGRIVAPSPLPVRIPLALPCGLIEDWASAEGEETQVEEDQ